MMETWVFFSLLVVILWGVVGLFQKLSTNYVSAEAAFVWLSVGYFLLLPAMFYYAGLELPLETIPAWLGVAAGTANGLGALALFAAMRSGGKASIVVPLTALYPLVTVLLAPVLFNEALTLRGVAGAVLSVVAIILLSE
ncbi:MAG: EamA family transporter [bacterium]|nr:EamA family transporter [bacterium]